MSCCRGREDTRHRSILYSILRRGSPCAQRRTAPAQEHICSCASRKKLVTIRGPKLVFKAVSDVLIKTFRFVKNVPCFRGLPTGDQIRLVRNSWAPLLILGLAQDSVDFDTVETQQHSLLHRILTHDTERQEDPGVPVDDVELIKTFLGKCRGLKISLKEYAYVKGAVLFCPEVTELECREYIQALQREAECALYEHVMTVYKGDTGRIGNLRVVLHTLRSVDPDAVAGLFFRPVTGLSCTDEHVLNMFYEINQ